MRYEHRCTGVVRFGRAGAALGLLFAATALAQGGGERSGVTIDADGSVQVPAHAVPLSTFLSPEGKAYVEEHLRNMQRPELLVQDSGTPPLLAGYLARQREVFAVDKKDVTIAGVHAFDYTPQGGVDARNRDRVLIDLHGGGFSGCWPGCAALESIPVAALGKIRVLALDYRQGPKFKFPAASEDVAAVYRELLKTYRAENVGIYGCSAGGMLTGQAVAWFQRHSLPAPGAIGVLCAGMTMAGNGFGGDSAYTTAAIGESRPPPPWPSRQPAGNAPLGYFSDAKLDDPLVAPASSAEVLAKFPPTLIVTGTRGFELSSAVYTHTQLVKQGVDAELHVWEGLFHGFFYNVDVPESRDCFDVIVKFFDAHLGRH
ncbi:MAG TPA: alpha/beta hydrolase fold domain-containing protein [Gammaproteobacteria bacterium]|nr:alpha/beta hydrolase fold domain-containing protein [Gammaproteobacteria bacterium]